MRARACMRACVRARVRARVRACVRACVRARAGGRARVRAGGRACGRGRARASEWRVNGEPFMQQLLHAALEHVGSALSTAFASLPNAGTAAAGGSAAAAAAAAGCPVEALGQYFMDVVYLDAVLSNAGPQCLSVDLAAAHQLLAARMCAGAGAAAGARGGAAAAPAETPLARSLLAIKDPQELNKKLQVTCRKALKDVLERSSFSVTVVESHSIPGGAAHTWERGGYHFESGPSLYSGMNGGRPGSSTAACAAQLPSSRGKDANPLAHVLQAIGEPLECVQYNTWNVLVPEGQFLTRIGNDNFLDVLSQIRGAGSPAMAEWRRLQEVMRPLAKAAVLLPPVAFRYDPGVLLSAIGRYLPALATGGTDAMKLTGPFSKVLDGVVSDSFIRNWLDLLSFLLSGLPANGTIAAEVAFMFNEWYRPDCMLDFPIGGSQAMVQALIRGLEKRGGRLLLNSHVERILLDSNGRATGVALRGGGSIKARKAVVSNASVWDTVRLLPPDLPAAQAAVSTFNREAQETPNCPSFMHLHIGFDRTGLPDDLELHHIIVNDWSRGVDAEQNVVLISIPSVKDPSMAPAGKHCLHAYLPATEPYHLWKGLDRKSPEYAKLKEERSQVLWKGVEKIIPDIRSRAEMSFVGTPLTHERYLRRARGSYGPAFKAGEALFPAICAT
ncbi:hypothetical protein COO60DRAFT_1705674 [Scenedesmus sp. NREL 46B-D3]|nr:hypothetical protein COO60DRAFT_1705674 [Scenedesmus sp. NREL 46B-D3]